MSILIKGIRPNCLLLCLSVVYFNQKVVRQEKFCFWGREIVYQATQFILRVGMVVGAHPLCPPESHFLDGYLILEYLFGNYIFYYFIV